MSRVSQAQRALIRSLLKQAEYDYWTVTLMYRRLDVAEHQIGGSVDTWLDSLDQGEASAVIEKLQAEVD